MIDHYAEVFPFYEIDFKFILKITSSNCIIEIIFTRVYDNINTTFLLRKKFYCR